MESKYLYIPIETKVREFHGKLLLSLFAAEKGFNVVLGSQDDLRQELHNLVPGIYLDKSISETKIPWFRKFRSLGYTVCAWDEEGLVFFDHATYQKMRFCDEAFDHVSLFFAWGDNQAEAMLSKRPDISERIRVTGNPRFDFLRPEFHCFYTDEVERIRSKFGSIILINTNFSFVNHFQGDERIRRQLNSYSISSQPGFFEGWTNAQRDAFESFQRLIPVLSVRYPEHTVLVRPHPSESFDPWNILADQFDNVVVNAEGNVQEWILASDVLVHFNCTTGIEAFYLDVPSIAFPKAQHDFYIQPLPNNLSIQATEVDELVTLIDSILKEGTNYPRLRQDDNRNSIAGKNIQGMDGLLASERIVDTLIKDIKGDFLPQTAEIEPPVPLIKRAWRQVLKLVRRPDERDLAYLDKKFSGLELQEVENNLERLQQITGRFESIRIEPVINNCFRITAI